MQREIKLSVFTVFCYGTGESHEKTNNIISQFTKACETDSIHIDGPGLLGFEVKSNAAAGTRQIIDWLKKQNDINNQINISGFSRGSITCIYIANNLKRQEEQLKNKENELALSGKQLDPEDKKLLNQLEKIDLNLFLQDPVAGISDKGKMDARVIPDNVKNYVAIIQLDEMRRDFKPQDITRVIFASPQTTKVSTLVMYGNHSDNTKIKNDNMVAGPQIVWHSLYQFLTQHGTGFKDGKIPEIIYSDKFKGPNELSQLPDNLTAKDLLLLFNKNHEERDHYKKSGLKTNLTDGIPVPRTKRTVNKHLEFYVKDSDFFTNQLERELFKLTYPKTFNYLFEHNQFDLRFPDDSNSESRTI